MKRLALVLALALIPAQAVAATTYISGDPTGGANGSGYNDMNEWRGDGVDSTFITNGLDFRNRQYVRLSNCTIMGQVGFDSLCRAVVLDSVKINGSMYFGQSDSCAVKNSTIIGAELVIGPADFRFPSDTLSADWWSYSDTLSNTRLILTPGWRRTGFNLRGARDAFVYAANCSINCRALTQAAAAKFYTVQRSTFRNCSWRIKNDDDARNQESGCWLKRDLASWNQFRADTITIQGSQQAVVNFSHSGNCGFADWCDRDRGNVYDSLFVINITPFLTDPPIYYAQRAEGDQFTNSLFVANENGFRLGKGSGQNYGLPPLRFTHNTFASLVNGFGFYSAQNDDALDGFIFTHNVVYSRKQGPTDQYTGAMMFNASNAAAVDTMNWNLYFRTYPDSSMWLKGTGYNYKSNPGAQGMFPVRTGGLDLSSFIGSPRFTDSSATLGFNPSPRYNSFALGSRWPHDYVGSHPLPIIGSLPSTPDSIYYTANGTRVRVAFRIPHDDVGVTGWELYRSTTNVASYKSATLYASDYRITTEAFAEGLEIVTAEVKQKANQTWYWYVVVRDTDGQYSAQRTKAITTTSGGGSWSWPP